MKDFNGFSCEVDFGMFLIWVFDFGNLDVESLFVDGEVVGMDYRFENVLDVVMSVFEEDLMEGLESIVDFDVYLDEFWLWCVILIVWWLWNGKVGRCFV